MLSILCSPYANRIYSTARIKSDNGKNCASQKQKADSIIRLNGDVSNLKLEKHERGMKMVLSSRLRSEVVDTEGCHGFTTDVIKAAIRNVNLTNAAGPDIIHPSFLHYLRSVSIPG